MNFKYDLRRVGMVKDTIHTTVPDTLYARGVELLNEREYNDALRILRPYEDRNTAVAMLSLGYDEQAYEVLRRLSEEATVEYLKAIACARMGRIEEGKAAFRRACELQHLSSGFRDVAVLGPCFLWKLPYSKMPLAEHVAFLLKSWF